ncbi:MAG: 50S ribosomal protein L21 [Chloroflexi bacterium]|nr:50S ribosomal protein L21 [Chloroflexota bacterium]MBT9163510.1 50S ribosomal protein L21 [Chloroflexota bacterium]MBT9165652.1 50S ribosomal protein L21 [Chloroflexota bacterium]
MAQIYAVIATGGKQYRVSPGQVIDVERLPGEKGSPVELGEVLLVVDGGRIVAGQAALDRARVRATIVNQCRQRKTIVFKYKSKVRYRRKRGHRQPYTRLMIDEIGGGGKNGT